MVVFLRSVVGFCKVGRLYAWMWCYLPIVGLCLYTLYVLKTHRRWALLIVSPDVTKGKILLFAFCDFNHNSAYDQTQKLPGSGYI
jgi:hypothetical protein